MIETVKRAEHSLRNLIMGKLRGEYDLEKVQMLYGIKKELREAVEEEDLEEIEKIREKLMDLL